MTGPVEEVEAAHSVGTVVLAVPGADATRIDLRVDALPRVVGGKGRADHLAGRVGAVLTGKWEERGFCSFQRGLDIAMDPDPGHGPTALHLDRSHDGKVVLQVAGRGAGTATGAAIEVHHHSPAMLGVLNRRVHLGKWRRVGQPGALPAHASG